jgi:hypothetical protein
MIDHNKFLRDKIQDIFPLSDSGKKEEVNEENRIDEHSVEFPTELPEPVIDDDKKDEIRERISNLSSGKMLGDMLKHLI